MHLPLFLFFVETASLSGTVVNGVTREPLNRVEILAESAQGTASATSNARGEFSFTGILPGQYRLKGVRNGYLDTYHGTPITLTAGEHLRGLRFKLQPFGVIAGKVRDGDGEPLVRATVTVHRLTYESGRRRITGVSDIGDISTDDFGDYRIAGLPPGKYCVRAAARDETSLGAEILLPGLFPDVELGLGARVTGIDITLPRSQTVPVSGRATAPAGTRLSAIFLTSDSGTGFEELGLRRSARRGADGGFSFAAVPPGSYRLVGAARTPGTASNDFFAVLRSQREYRSSIPLVVGSSPVKDVRLAVVAPAEVTGVITIDTAGKELAQSIRNAIAFADGINEPVHAPIREDMNFNAGLEPGRYSVSLRPATDPVIRSITYDGRDILREGLTVADDSPKHLEVVLAMDGGRVEGMVSDHEDKAVPGALVVLIPEAALRSNAALFQTCETDQHGKYTIPNIPPGRYSLFAWTGIEPGIWWDAAFLQVHENKGQAVTVGVRREEKANLRVIAKSPRADP